MDGERTHRARTQGGMVSSLPPTPQPFALVWLHLCPKPPMKTIVSFDCFWQQNALVFLLLFR